MLTRFYVDNFKSHINTEFRPGPVNLVLGRNNSGKTNLCQALEFLSMSARAPLEEAAWPAGGSWNLANAYLSKDTVSLACECTLASGADTFAFDYELRIRVLPAPHLGQIGRELLVEHEQLLVSGGSFPRDTQLLSNDGGQVRLLHEGRLAQGDAEPFVATTAPTNATMLSRLYDLQHNRAANLFKQYVSTWLFYDLEPSRIRACDARTPGFVLDRDGSNLAQVVFALKTTDDLSYRRFIETVRGVEPKLDAINFIAPARGQELIPAFLTDSQGTRFPMAWASSGTLRYMALAYVVSMARLAPGEYGTPERLVVIEEPENGLHVSLLKSILEMAEPGGGPEPQFVFTSHSPYFIDLFDQYPEYVFLARSDTTHTEIVRPGRERIDRLLDEFSLGEAHFRELLG